MLQTLRELPNIHRNIAGIFFSSKWQYWINPRELSVPSLYCFGQFVFRLHLAVLCLSVLVSNRYTVQTYVA